MSPTEQSLEQVAKTNSLNGEKLKSFTKSKKRVVIMKRNNKLVHSCFGI